MNDAAADHPAPYLRALHEAERELNRLIVGKPEVIRHCLTALLARGHLLLEDLPGVGKTTLAHGLAAVFDLRFSRVQFTSDLLPADLVGVSIWRREKECFEFQPGPLFAQLVLADELNRGSPKTQGALLEAMAEQQITVDGVSRPLPAPFFVIATQNPHEQVGTFPLPESQLDRFLMVLSLGYPDAAAERELLLGEDRRQLLRRIDAKLGSAELLGVQARVEEVRAAPALIDYVQRLLHASRTDPAIRIGLSPRAGLSLLRAARAHALLEGRGYVLPEDVQATFAAVAAHRLSMRDGAPSAAAWCRGLLDRTPVQ